MNIFYCVILSHAPSLSLFGGANPIIRSADRGFAESLNTTDLPRTHADRHCNRVVA